MTAFAGRAGPVPVLAPGDVPPVTPQGEPHDGAAEQLQQDIARRVAHTLVPVGGVVSDLSGVDIADSFLGGVLAEIAAGARLPDARTVLAGMPPAVAVALVEPGLTLPDLVTAPDVARPLSLLGAAPSPAPPARPEEGA
jgi:rsbT antagonist protein RsbS